MEKLNKEYHIRPYGNMRLVIGCVNKNNPQVLYINGKTWVSGCYDVDDDKIDSIIFRRAKTGLKNEIKNISSLFDSKFIMDIDFTTKLMKPEKKRFLSFSIFVKQKGNKKLKELKSSLTDISNTVSREIIDTLESNDFITSLKR